MSEKPKGSRYEPRAASNLEIGMLEYQLTEAREQLEEQYSRIAAMEEREEYQAKVVKTATQTAEAFTKKNTILIQRVRVLQGNVNVWRSVALAEAAGIVCYILVYVMGVL